MRFWIRSCEDPFGLISNWLCKRHRQTHSLESQIDAQDGCIGRFGNTPNVPYLVSPTPQLGLIYRLKKQRPCWRHWLLNVKLLLDSKPLHPIPLCPILVLVSPTFLHLPVQKMGSVPLQRLQHNLEVLYVFPFGLIFLFLLWKYLYNLISKLRCPFY